MNNGILYVMTVLIWGSTWIGIKYQLGVVDPTVSVAHRFLLSAVLLFLFNRLRGQSLALPAREHPFLLLQGACLFSVNYYFVYSAELVLTSGLVAVVFSCLLLFNVINGAIFMGAPVRGRVVIGGLVGLLGMCAVFWPELDSLDFSDRNFRALLMCLAGTLLASFGNIIAARNRQHEIPVLVTNCWAMAYGAAIMYLAAIASGATITLDWSAPYLLSLLYLAVFGSVVAFWAYLTLIGRMGPDRAGYANLLFPLVALAISTAVEGYTWTVAALLGMGAVLLGNWLVMRSNRG